MNVFCMVLFFRNFSFGNLNMNISTENNIFCRINEIRSLQIQKNNVKNSISSIFLIYYNTYFICKYIIQLYSSIIHVVCMIIITSTDVFILIPPLIVHLEKKFYVTLLLIIHTFIKHFSLNHVVN